MNTKIKSEIRILIREELGFRLFSFFLGLLFLSFSGIIFYYSYDLEPKGFLENIGMFTIALSSSLSFIISLFSIFIGFRGSSENE